MQLTKVVTFCLVSLFAAMLWMDFCAIAQEPEILQPWEWAPQPKAFTSPKIKEVDAALQDMLAQEPAGDEAKLSETYGRVRDRYIQDPQVTVWIDYREGATLFYKGHDLAKAVQRLKAAEKGAGLDADLALILPSIHFYLGQLYLKINETDGLFKQAFPLIDPYEEAISNLLKVISEAPSWPIADGPLGMIVAACLKHNQRERAEGILRDILDKQANEELAAQAAFRLAYLRALDQDWDGVIRTYQEVIDKHPGTRAAKQAERIVGGMSKGGQGQRPAGGKDGLNKTENPGQNPDTNDPPASGGTASSSAAAKGCCGSSEPNATAQLASGKAQSPQSTCTCGKTASKSSCGSAGATQPDSCCALTKNPSVADQAKGATSPQAQATDFAGNCGVRALARVMEAQGAMPERVELAALAKVDAGGATMLGLKCAAEAKGFAARGLKATAEELKALHFPLVAYVGGNHFVALMRVEGDAVVVVDGEQGEKSVAMEEFGKQWSGELLEITKK